MAATIRTVCCSVLQRSCRSFSTTCGLQGGKDWRIKHGLAPTAYEYGPLTDLPDWSYADGRPAPPTQGMLRRREERTAMARRIVFLNKELDEGMEKWKQKVDAAKREAEYQKSLLLKPKGKKLLKKEEKNA